MKGGVSLKVKLAGIELRNPTMLASGILGTTLPLLERVYECGAGAVVSKSISKEKREGYRNPTIVSVDCGFVNAIGLSNPGINEFVKEIRRYKKDFPLIVSLFGSTPKEFEYMAKKLNDTWVKGIEINLSCPHVEKFGIEVGQDVDLSAKIIRVIKKVTDKPVFPKLSPHITNLGEFAKILEQEGADGIVAINTVKAMVIDIETHKPVLSNKFGGLSGNAIRPIAVRCVYEVSKSVNIPVIGVGGISSWEHAAEFILAGAKAVQIGSALAYNEFDLFERICEGLKDWIERKGKSGIEEMVALAQRY